MKRLLIAIRQFGPRQDGIAAVEFAIWLAVMVPALLSAFDVSLYGYQKVQVANAAQALAQAVFSASTNAGCSYSATAGPTASNCSVLTTAFKTNAINRSSSLGAAGGITENTSGESYGYYCVDGTTGALSANATATCSSPNVVSSAGYYYKVQVTFTYAPMFSGMTVASLLGTTIQADSWVRLQ